ncbi:MAG: amidohydrolase [Planctomycetes bacterium]|nr:amidohydrolase [Planctomycetota bacterium]
MSAPAATAASAPALAPGAPAASPVTLPPDIAALRDELVALRRDLHAHPELGFREERTAAEVARRLRALGLEVKTGVAQTGVVALLHGAHPGPTVLLRADMDALPLTEENAVPYASTVPGVMHACGHDAHTAILATAAKALLARRERLHGAVKLVFQPAEESPGGALPRIQAGVLDHPPVAAAFGLHMWNDFPLGRVAVRSGPLLASTDKFEIVVHGKGGHGAAPHQAVDPVVAAAHVVLALQTLSSRLVDPLTPVVLSICSVHGGSAFNIIPDTVSLLGTIRTFDRDLARRFPEMIDRIAAGACAALGARHELNYTAFYPPTINDREMAAVVRRAAEAVVGPAGIADDLQTLGGEDMSFFLERVPGCYFFVGSANPDKGFRHPHHSSRFDIDEDALPIGLAILVGTVERYLAGR